VLLAFTDRRVRRTGVDLLGGPATIRSATEFNVKRVLLPWTTLYADTTGGTYKFFAVTAYMTVAQFRRIRGVIETMTLMTNFSVTLGYQLANVETSPQTAVPVGSAITTNTVSFGTLADISADIDDYQLIRFGFLTQNTQSATLIFGRAGGYVEYTDC
jgi:hypothetical protein